MRRLLDSLIKGADLTVEVVEVRDLGADRVLPSAPPLRAATAASRSLAFPSSPTSAAPSFSSGRAGCRARMAPRTERSCCGAAPSPTSSPLPARRSTSRAPTRIMVMSSGEATALRGGRGLSGTSGAASPAATSGASPPSARASSSTPTTASTATSCGGPVQSRARRPRGSARRARNLCRAETPALVPGPR